MDGTLDGEKVTEGLQCLIAGRGPRWHAVPTLTSCVSWRRRTGLGHPVAGPHLLDQRTPQSCSASPRPWIVGLPRSCIIRTTWFT